MFRRIGDFLKDITETLKRERGKLQIKTDPVEFSLRVESFQSSEQQISIQDSKMFQKLFVPLSIEDHSQKVTIHGESDHSASVHVRSATTTLKVNLNRLVESESVLSIIDNPCELGEKIALQGIALEDVYEQSVVEDIFQRHSFGQVAIKEESLSDDFDQSSRPVKGSEMSFSAVLKSLETDFESQQRLAFHFDNAVIFSTSLEAYTPFFHMNCHKHLSLIMKFPIKRNRVSKAGYETEELKRALSFIVNRYEHRGKLSIVGIYKNVPIDTVERMTFSKGQELFFYLKKGNQKRQILMDVLIVRTNEGRYHVGPIVRKA